MPPLRGGDAEQRDVQQIGFGRVNDGGLGLGDTGRNQAIPDGVGVYLVVDLGQGALEIPLQRLRAILHP